jgi:hypothetical protein
MHRSPSSGHRFPYDGHEATGHRRRELVALELGPKGVAQVFSYRNARLAAKCRRGTINPKHGGFEVVHDSSKVMFLVSPTRRCFLRSSLRCYCSFWSSLQCVRRIPLVYLVQDVSSRSCSMSQVVSLGHVLRPLGFKPICP